ncbi:hypothetical protein ACHAXR_012018 [Thalassiosira sp. AJA248-18]
MDDDLDAFFDDVDNAVKEVQETAITAEDDGKDAAAAGAVKTDESSSANNDNEERPAKRAKVAIAASSVPVKSIVASSVPVISIAPPLPAGPPPVAASSSATKVISIIPPPPPPPPNNNPSYHQHQMTGAQHPPLPPGLPPTENTTNANKPHVRSAAGTTWSDPTLSQWPPNDFRLFVGNLAKDLKEHHLTDHFQSKYPSFAMARIMYNKTDGKSRGYGFVSLLDAKDCARAIREMDQSWLGSRPIKVKLSEWKDREWKEVKKKGRVEKRKKKKHFGL